MSFFATASAHTFAEIVRCVMPSRGRLSSARENAEIFGVSAEVQRMLRSIGMISEINGTPLFQAEGRVFLETMAPFSATDGIAALSHAVPMRTRIAALSAIIAGDGPGEGLAKSCGAFDLTDGQAAPLKAIALVAESEELARALGEAGTAFLLSQLRNALALATDQVFFPAILEGISATPATGTDASALRLDVATALTSMELGQNSRPLIVVDPNQAIRLALMEDAGGRLAFPDMGFSGGTISGLPVFVSGGIPLDTDTSPGTPQLVIADAQALAIDVGEIVLMPGSEANLTVDGTTVNLWQSNLSALLAERVFSASVVRAGGVVAISGSYGGGGITSP